MAKLFGYKTWWDDEKELTKQQKTARKMWEQHFYGDSQQKKEAEDWFNKRKTWVTADLLKDRKYKEAAAQLANSYRVIPSQKTLDDVKKWRPQKYSVKNRTVENANTQANRAIKSLNNNPEFERRADELRAKIDARTNTPEEWDEFRKMYDKRFKREEQIKRARDNRIARLEQANKPQEQPQSRLVEPSKPKTTDKKSSGASTRGRANGVG